MRELNYDEAIAVTRDIYWVGCFDTESQLQSNPYLLVDDEDVVFIDPGSIPDFPVIMRKVIDVVHPGSISFIVAQHQDPDVCGNLAVVEDVIDNPELRIASHRISIRLIRHLAPVSRFFAVDKHDYRITLKSGRVLEFMPTPYLHAPGAIVTYDTQTKSLFSSDLFGSIGGNWCLFAEGDFFTPMTQWHQAYMPSNRILRRAIERIESRWQVDRILPQHGSILEGDQVIQAFAHLKKLPCGIDLEKD